MFLRRKYDDQSIVDILQLRTSRTWDFLKTHRIKIKTMQNVNEIINLCMVIINRLFADNPKSDNDRKHNEEVINNILDLFEPQFKELFSCNDILALLTCCESNNLSEAKYALAKALIPLININGNELVMIAKLLTKNIDREDYIRKVENHWEKTYQSHDTQLLFLNGKSDQGSSIHYFFQQGQAAAATITAEIFKIAEKIEEDILEKTSSPKKS